MTSTILTVSNARRIMRLDEHAYRVRDFRGHQMTLAGMFIIQLWGATFYEPFLVLAMLTAQAGWTYALRFRRTGCMFMTRRSIWIGATPVDERARPSLNGWTP